MSDVGVTFQAAAVVSPVPWIATLIGEEGASLVIVSVALAVIVFDAVNVTVTVFVAPDVSSNGTAIELRENPEPVMLTPVTVRLALPLFRI